MFGWRFVSRSASSGPSSGAVTFDAAWQCHMDNIVGSLEPGPLCNQTADPTLLLPVYYLTPIRM
jgi:hypothetical protein